MNQPPSDLMFGIQDSLLSLKRRIDYLEEKNKEIEKSTETNDEILKQELDEVSASLNDLNKEAAVMRASIKQANSAIMSLVKQLRQSATQEELDKLRNLAELWKADEWVSSKDFDRMIENSKENIE